MLVVPELEKEVELLWHLRDMRKVNGSSLHIYYHSERERRFCEIVDQGFGFALIRINSY